jgi:hypothetical protein
MRDPSANSNSVISAGDEHSGVPSAVRAWLDRHRAIVSAQRNRLRVLDLRWSWARLLTFLSVFLVTYPLRGVPVLAMALGAGVIGLFIWSISRHRRTRTALELAQREMLMIEESSARCDGWVALIRGFVRSAESAQASSPLTPILEDGPTWALTDQERDDLDMHAGPVGVFGLLNRTSTSPGRRRLQDMLDHPCLSIERIVARQQAIGWLAAHPDERFRIMARTAGLRDEDELLERFIRLVREAQPLPAGIPARRLRVWSLVSGLIVAISVMQIVAGRVDWVWPFIGVFFLNMLMFARSHKQVKTILDPWREMVGIGADYLATARQAEADLPADTELALLRDRFSAVTRPAALPSLCNWLGWSDVGGMFHQLFNVLVFYDLHMAQAVLSRAIAHRDTLLAGLAATADLEALYSLACFAWEQPVACYPLPTDQKTFLIVGGKHPLIAPDRVVANDVDLSPQVRTWLITGSNMAGKSTFLRTVGINALLAQVGSAVCAERMTFSPVRLITDLRARDNLANDESYFLAEVRQLRRMVLPPEGEATILGLIDEPYRGTNADEQAAAGWATVEHLLATPHFFLVATHERRLTELANNGSALNHHFQEELGPEGMIFDYRLRSGPAQTRNALLVMEREGYPPDLMKSARAWIANLRPGEDTLA